MGLKNFHEQAIFEILKIDKFSCWIPEVDISTSRYLENQKHWDKNLSDFSYSDQYKLI